jgi:superfamily II DNA/RNA helicase
VKGEGIPKPCLTFEEASMPSYVQDEVLRCGFPTPTPIQSQGWPMALLGRDMIGISKTGLFLVKEAMLCVCFLDFVSFVRTSPIQSSLISLIPFFFLFFFFNETGSGKTLAFLLPAMIHINAQV